MNLFAERRILTVSQLTGLVKGVLEENFEHVWVEGEVSNFSMPASGHFYFTLKDAGAQLRCVMFRASARALKFKPRDGMVLVLRGRISVYDQRGEYQLLAEYMEPKGVGALQLAFSQLKERLAKEGLFDEAHKKPIPALPQRIGIVTSPTGAAIHDMLNVLNRRFTNLEILIYPVRVQGEGAAAEIAQAIRDFNRYREVDVLIVGRGGGSLEDLWAFNEEEMARAIYNSKIPVISAVGHEVDYTIADFVADLRAPTPSAAAELVVKSKVELAAQVDNLSRRLVHGVQRRMQEVRGELNSLSRALKEPTMLLGHLGQRVDDLAGRLERVRQVAMTQRRERLAAMVAQLHMRNPALAVERSRERLLAVTGRMNMAIRRLLDRAHEQSVVSAAKLQALSPLSTLGRGYSIARRMPLGEIVTDSAKIETGDRLELTFHHGRAFCRVEEKL